MMTGIAITPLNLDQCEAWARLLALTFDRTVEDMRRLLVWLHQGYPLVAYGAWDGERLAAQYATLLVDVQLSVVQTVKIGMSLNMSVHPDYRGQGLIKQVSKPVYARVAELGGIAGVGFSNADGVKVDQRSKGYGYQVVGQMQPMLAWLRPSKRVSTLALTDSLPEIEDQGAISCASTTSLNVNGQSAIHFTTTSQRILHRYAQHPFRRYCYGVWQEGNSVCGIVVYREVRLRGWRGVALLGAYGYDLDELIARWALTMTQHGIHAVHLLTTPNSQIRAALQTSAWGVRVPTRNPYYLTAKALDSQAAPLFDFNRWDCVGGDIL